MTTVHRSTDTRNVEEENLTATPLELLFDLIPHLTVRS